MKHYLLVSCRPGGAVADSERADICQYGKIPDDKLETYYPERPGPRPALDEYAAVFLSGSPYNILTAQDAKTAPQVQIEQVMGELCEEILDRDIPTLGLCYGLQMLTVAAGGTLTRDYPETISAPYHSLTAEGRTDPLLADTPDTFRAFVGHGESVGEIPSSMTVLATSDAVPVQMARFGNHVYGTQFHPEIGREGIQIRIDAYGGSYFAEDERQKVLDECLTAYTDHTIISRFTHLYRS